MYTQHQCQSTDEDDDHRGIILSNISNLFAIVRESFPPSKHMHCSERHIEPYTGHKGRN